MTNNGSLVFNVTGTESYAYPVSGTGSLTVSGGPLDMTGKSIAAGAVTVTEEGSIDVATITASSCSLSGQSAITLSGDTVSRRGFGQCGSAISGTYAASSRICLPTTALRTSFTVLFRALSLGIFRLPAVRPWI